MYIPLDVLFPYLCILLHQVSGSSQEDKRTRRYQSDFCRSCLLIHSHGDLQHTHPDLEKKNIYFVFELSSSSFNSWRQLQGKGRAVFPKQKHWRNSPKSMIKCNYLDPHELHHFVMLKMKSTTLTFLALQSPSRATLDDKNTKNCFFVSSERANHHLLGCLLHSTEGMNARCAEIFGLCAADGRRGEVYTSVITFAHLLVFP